MSAVIVEESTITNIYIKFPCTKMKTISIKIISKSFYKRMNYLNEKLYWITDRTIIIFLNEGLDEIKKYDNYNRIPFNKHINPIYKYYCNKLNI